MMTGSSNRQGLMEASIELNRPLPMEMQELKDSSKLERKTRIRTIKFDLDEPTERGGKMNRNHSSDTDLIAAFKSTKKTTRRGSGGRLGGRKKGVLRKTGGAESLARMKEVATEQQKNHSSCGNLDLAGHMTKLKEKQGGGLPSWFRLSDPNLELLDLSDFDKGGPRRRRSSRGKKVPLQRRSYPSSKFCETELPPLVPFPSRATFGRLSPVFFDCGTVKAKATVSNVLDMDSERFANELPAVTPEQNDSTAMTA